MSSLQRRPRSKYWIAHFQAWDASKARWKRVSRSTKCTDKDAAQRVLDAFEAAARTAAGMPDGTNLSPDHLHGVVAGVLGLAGVQVTKPEIPTVRAYVERFHTSKVSRVKPQSLASYNSSRHRFENWLPKTEVRLDWLTPARIQDYYTHLLANLGPKTANSRMAWLKALLNRAVEEGHLPRNPCSSVDLAPAKGQLHRLPFTLQEALQIVDFLHKQGAREKDWARAALVALQSGARLVDCITLERSAFRQEGKVTVLHYVAAKTGKRNACPLVLSEWLPFLLEGDSTDLCPLLANEYRRIGNANLSSEFTKLVGQAGVPQLYAQDKHGRQLARKTFHSLRHTLRTAIVLSGGSDAQADLVLGHSAGQGKAYTHSELNSMAATLQRALNSEPDASADR